MGTAGNRISAPGTFNGTSIRRRGGFCLFILEDATLPKAIPPIPPRTMTGGEASERASNTLVFFRGKNPFPGFVMR
jgi:hypothetical protein